MWLRWFFCFPLLLSLSSCETSSKRSEAEKAIRSQSAAYAEAFNKRDAKGIASLWAEESEYVDPETGLLLVDREAIEEAYQTSFADDEEVHIDILIDKISFPSSEEAIEVGTALLRRPEEEPDRTAYQAYYKKEGGQWLLTEIREVEVAPPPSPNEHLLKLSWLVGDWIDEDQDTKIETDCQWDKYKNFLTQHFRVMVEEQMILEGRQIIGWDPIRKRVRSWVFDSDGGFGEGTWREEEGHWVVETSSTLADGSRASSINIYTPLNENRYRWESTGREVDGEILPDIEPVTVERKR